MLEELISQFKLAAKGFGAPSLPSRNVAQPAESSPSAANHAYETQGSDDFGKY
jgi:hypothetical protein